jgi:hypothetical protein
MKDTKEAIKLGYLNLPAIKEEFRDELLNRIHALEAHKNQLLQQREGD